MPKGNWSGNPPAQSEAGNVNSGRGKTGAFSGSQGMRKTGKVGTGSMTDNMEVDSELAPKGRPVR